MRESETNANRPPDQSEVAEWRRGGRYRLNCRRSTNANGRRRRGYIQRHEGLRNGRGSSSWPRKGWGLRKRLVSWGYGARRPASGGAVGGTRPRPPVGRRV